MPPSGDRRKVPVGPGGVMHQRVGVLQEIYQPIPPAGSDPMGTPRQLVIRDPGHVVRPGPAHPIAESVSGVAEPIRSHIPGTRREFPGLPVDDRLDAGLRRRRNWEILPRHLTLDHVPEATRLPRSVYPDS